MKKVAIVDTVGIKAGMDHYDLSLLHSLSELSVPTYLFSNFQRKHGDIFVFCTFNAEIKNKLLKLLNFFKGHLQSYYYCKVKKIGVVILHLFSASFLNLLWILLARTFKLKVFIIAHDIVGFGKKDSKVIKKFIYDRIADKIIVHNQFSLDEISKIVNQRSLKKIKIIKQGNYLALINNEVTKNSARKMLNLDTYGKYVLFFGQIKKVKGLDLLLNAMPHVDNKIKLIIAGKPWQDDFREYQKIIDCHGLRSRIIKKVRFIEDSEREMLFKAADALILPYRIIYQSSVLLMAMSYGLPVVISDLKPNCEVIKDQKNGILFRNGNQFSLAKKINGLFQDDGLIKKIRTNAIETVKNQYSWDKIAKEYQEILE